MNKLPQKFKQAVDFAGEFIPSPFFAALAAAGAFFLLCVFWMPFMLLLFYAYVFALGIVFIIDIVVTPPKESFSIRRSMEHKCSLKEKHKVCFEVRNNSSMETVCLVKDTIPAEFEFETRVVSCELLPHSLRAVFYSVSPSKRGYYEFGPVAVRYASRLKCFVRQFSLSEKSPLKVYPLLLHEEKLQFLAKKERVFDAGMNPSKIFGSGFEFERLREYQPDDEYRRINWKATARMAKPISEEYETERVQNVFLMMDCGRNMAAHAGGTPKFDYVLRAALALIFLAAKKDDRVGFLTFHAEPRSFLPLGKGRNQILSCMEKLYDEKPEMLECDFRKAFSFLHEFVRKRSLVIFFTDILSPQMSAAFLYYLNSIRYKHLVLCVLVKDAALFQDARKEAEGVQDVYRRAVALNLIREREKTIAVLRSVGCHVIDAACEHLTPSVLNKYLELKARASL